MIIKKEEFIKRFLMILERHLIAELPEQESETEMIEIACNIIIAYLKHFSSVIS